MIRRPVVHWHYLAEPYTILYLSRAVSYSKPYRNLDCLSEYTAVDTIQVFKYVLLTDVYIYIYIYIAGLKFHTVNYIICFMLRCLRSKVKLTILRIMKNIHKHRVFLIIYHM